MLFLFDQVGLIRKLHCVSRENMKARSPLMQEQVAVHGAEVR